MKKIAALMLVAVLVLPLMACPAPHAFVKASKSYQSRVGKKLLQYVEADPTLQESDKKAWRALVAEYDKTIKEAER